jgi:hypothetical protein
MPYPKSEKFRNEILTILGRLGQASAYDIFKEMTKDKKSSFREHNKLRVRVAYHLRMLKTAGKVEVTEEVVSDAPIPKKIYKPIEGGGIVEKESRA